MKERKPLFPEYIWMFFVGLLLAIIVCMRLLPGHAETVNPVYGNPNVFTWESLQNPTSVFQAPFNTSGWINSEGNIYLDASVYRSNDSGASFYGPMIDYEYVALQNPIIYGEIGATYSGTDLITVSSNNNNGTVPVSAIPSSLYYQFFEHGYSYFACDLWCFPWESWSNNPVNIGYVILKMSSGSVPTVYKRTGLANYSLFQVDLDSSNIVDMMYYFNNNIGYYDVDLDYVLADRWVNFGGTIEDSADEYFLFTDPELNEDYKLFISTVYMGNFNFQHTGDWNEQYSKNYKYRITVDSRYFEAEALASPTPAPDASEPCFTYCVKCDTSYYLVDIYGEVGYDLQANADDIFNQIASEYNSTNRTLLRSCFVIKNDRFNGTAANWQYTGPYIIFYGQFNSFSKAVSYNMGSSYISDFDYVRSTFTGIEVPESTSYEAGYLGYKLQTLTEGGYCLGLWTRGAMTYASSPSVVEYCDFDYVTTSFSYNYYPITLDPFMLTINASYPKTMHNYYLSLVARLGLSDNSPVEGDASPTPSPTATPTQAPYVEVILPSPTPGPTAPVSFSGSDLPGGGAGGIDGTSGNAGSISTNGGASPSTANGVYNYWSNVLSQNQALAFIASFFQILPFDLVYALGSLIFILTLLAMARLFIHFIE